MYYNTNIKKTQKEKASSIVAIAKEGNLGRACGRLEEFKVFDDKDKAYEILQEKHPKNPTEIKVKKNVKGNLVVENGSLLEAIEEFPVGTAAGPSGLYP